MSNFLFVIRIFLLFKDVAWIFMRKDVYACIIC